MIYNPKKPDKMKESLFLRELRMSIKTYSASMGKAKMLDLKIHGSAMTAGWPDVVIIGGSIPDQEALFIETKTIKFPKRGVSMDSLLTLIQSRMFKDHAEINARSFLVVALGRNDAIAISAKKVEQIEKITPDLLFTPVSNDQWHMRRETGKGWYPVGPFFFKRYN